MHPIVFVHGYSAESHKRSSAAIRRIYAGFPEALAERLDRPVHLLNLSRWISLDDGIRLDDVSRAFDRALYSDEFSELLRSGFDAVIHSTGALVLRNWLRRFSPAPSPLQNLVHLAGANFGSGWAHIGRAQVMKWGRYVFNHGADRGLRILNALELGGSETLDLHLDLMRRNVLEHWGVREFCIIGSQPSQKWFMAPIRYAKEDGSDGVVRVSGGNLNFHYVRLEPTEAALRMSFRDVEKEVERNLDRRRTRGYLYRLAEESHPGSGNRPAIPFTIPFQCAHGGDEMGILVDSACRQEVVEHTAQALETTADTFENCVARFRDRIAATYRTVAEEQTPGLLEWVDPRRQYDPHAQVTIRLRDQDGRPVPQFDVFFAPTGSQRSRQPRPEDTRGLGSLVEHTHVNGNTITFYLRLETFDPDAGEWTSRLPRVGDCELEITATDPETDRILYLPLRLEMPNETLQTWLRPHETTIVDVTILRIPAEETVVLRRL